MTQLYVKVQPDSEEFRIEKGTYPKIHLENRAENRQANAELLDRLEEITGEKPGIVSGHKSRRKKIAIDMPKKEFEKCIEREINE